ncbi:SAM-dependent methyltransferase, partial [Micromonospora provocatoris]
MGKPTRWVTDTKPGHSQWYVDRFRQLAAEGADLSGEATAARRARPSGAARVLDAGCGT